MKFTEQMDVIEKNYLKAEIVLKFSKTTVQISGNRRMWFSFRKKIMQMAFWSDFYYLQYISSMTR